MTSDPETTATDQGQIITGAAPGLATPAGMVALGSIILLGTYLLFGVLLNDYWVGWIAVLLSIGALLLLRVDSSFVEKLAPVPVLVKLIGYTLGVVGALALLEDLRFANGTLNEFPELIGALVAYAGYVVAFLGARSIKT